MVIHFLWKYFTRPLNQLTKQIFDTDFLPAVLTSLQKATSKLGHENDFAHLHSMRSEEVKMDQKEWYENRFKISVLQV